MPLPAALSQCLEDLTRHLSTLSEELETLRSEHEVLKRKHAENAEQLAHVAAQRHGYHALSKVEQLEMENETMSRQIDELKAQLYMTCALEEAPKPRTAWLKTHQDPGLSRSNQADPKRVSFTQVIPRPEFVDERPPTAEPVVVHCCLQSEEEIFEGERHNPERLQAVKRVTTNDVKRQMSFKRHEREGTSAVQAEESLAASKMNMLKRNPFDEAADPHHSKSFSESWKDAIKILNAPQSGTFIERVAAGVFFKSFAMVAIVANTIYLGYAANLNVRSSYNRLQDLPTVTQSRVVDIAFAGWFGVEILTRAAAEKVQFITGDEKFWNLLDVFLVTESLITLAWDLPSSLSFLRLLRVFRLVRIVRLVRTVQALRKLRTMIFAMLNSFADLLWALQVVLLIIFVFSLIFLNAVASHFDYTKQHLAHDSLAMARADELHKTYGDLYSSMQSLWSAVSGGNDWMQYAEPLSYLSESSGMGEFYFIVFNFYVAFCVVGLFNVVTGVFVDSAVCTRTEDEIVQGYLDEMKSMTESIKGFLKKADKDASGTLTYEEFQAHMSNPVVKAYFSGLDIDPDETKIIFTLLDSDCNGDIDIEEFVHGTMKLKGYATKLDIMALMYDATQQSIRFDHLCEYWESQMHQIMEVLQPKRRSSV